MRFFAIHPKAPALMVRGFCFVKRGSEAPMHRPVCLNYNAGVAKGLTTCQHVDVR